MQQKINLNMLSSQRKKSFLTPKLLIVSYGIFVLLLFFNTTSEIWDNYKRNQSYNALRQEAAGIQQRLMVFKIQYPMINRSDKSISIKKLQKDLEEKNNVLHLLLNRCNFSSYLIGLAKAAVPGVWLINIAISSSEQDIVLKGYASTSEAMEKFIGKLVLQSEFSDVQLKLKEMNPTKLEKENVLSFIVSATSKSLKVDANQ